MQDQQYAEERVIAAAISDPDTIPDLHIDLSDFVIDRNRLIWQAITDSKTKSIDDIASLLEQRTNHRWLPDLIEITIEEHGNSGIWVDILKKQTIRRRAIDICKGMMRSIYEREEGAVERGIAELNSVVTHDVAPTYTLSSAAEGAIAVIERRMAGESVIKTGISKIDNFIGGFHEGDLVVIGARPGVGKTSMMMQMAVSSARNHVPIGIFSGEQPAEQLAERVMACTGRASIHDIRNGNVDVEALKAIASRMHDYTMHISDTACPSLDHISRVTRQWIREHGIKAVFVDYLQRMKGNPKLPKHERVGELVQGLKTLALQCKIPVVVLAQLNRQLDRDDRLPRMSDLKDSGDIEQEADQIFLLHTDNSDQTAPTSDASVVLDKNRHGGVCTFGLTWHRARMQFAGAER